MSLLGRLLGVDRIAEREAARRASGLEKRIVALENGEAMRALEVLEYIQRFERLGRKLLRAERNQEPARTPAGAARATPAPPSGLRGARLRIWQREHGTQRSYPDEIVQPESTLEAENGSGGVNGVHS